MEDNKKKWIKRAILIVIDLALALVISYTQYKNPSIAEGISIPYALANGFIIIGFMNFGFGALLRISSTGFFDIFGFSAKAILNFFIPRATWTNKEDYYEYKVRKAEKRKDRPVSYDTLIIGIVMIVISIIFNILVYA